MAVSIFVLRLPGGQLNLKWRKDSLFSERYGYAKTMTVGPFRLTWHGRRG